MEFGKTSQLYSLNKSTYINLRWIGIIGQFITINSVRFIFDFEFNYIFANLIILIGAISNLFLIFFYKKTHLSNRSAFNFLLIDIIQLAALLYLSGGILNPFAIFLLIPSVFASSSLDIKTNIILIGFTITSTTRPINYKHLYLLFNPFSINYSFIISKLFCFIIWKRI